MSEKISSFLNQEYLTPERLRFNNLELILSYSPLNVLYWLRDYLKKQQEVEDKFQQMKKGEITHNDWQKSAEELQEKFHINEISEFLAGLEQIKQTHPSHPYDNYKESREIITDFVVKNIAPENIEAVKIIRGYRLGALSNADREFVDKLLEKIQSKINTQIDIGRDKEFIDPETGRLKGRPISVKGTGLDTSLVDKHESGHGHDLYTDITLAEKYHRRPDELLGLTEDEEDEDFLKRHEPNQYVPIEEIGKDDNEEEGKTFTDEWYAERAKKGAAWKREQKQALKQEKKAQAAKNKSEQEFMEKREKLWPLITAEHNGLSLKLIHKLNLTNYCLEMVRDYLIALLKGDNDVASTFELPAKIKSKNIDSDQVANPRHFIRKFNLEEIHEDQAEFLKDELQKIISDRDYFIKKEQRKSA